MKIQLIKLNVLLLLCTKMYCTTIEGDYFESDENSSPPTKTTTESHTSKVESISISSSYVHSTSPIPTLPINITSTTISILETSSHYTNENSGQNHSIETSTRAEDESSTILHMDFDSMTKILMIYLIIKTNFF